MSSKSSSSDSSSNGSNVTRFTLDGVVAEMVVEVDDDQEPFLSPSKALKLNGVDTYEKLKASALRRSFVALDPILKMDDIKISNIQNPEQKDSNSKQDETNISSKEFQKDQTPLMADVLDEQEVSTNAKSDSSKVKESDVFNEDEESQPTEAAEMLQKDLTKIDDDESAIDEVTETNEGELPEQDEDNSLVEEGAKKDEAESPEEDENKSTFDAATKITKKSPEKDENKSIVEELIESNEAQSSENDENNSVAEISERNEAQSSENDENKSVAEMTETNEAQSSENDENKSVAEMTETNEAQSSENDENKSAAEMTEKARPSGKDESKSAAEITETNEAWSSESDENNSAVERTETNEVKSSEKDESKSTVEEVTKTNEVQSLEKKEKSALDRLTETIVVGCESTEFEMLDVKALSGSRKFSKLPLKKRKLREPEKAKEDVKVEDEPEPRALRARPSEKEKKEVKNTNAKKRKDISSKSTPAPVKKAKSVKEEYPKKGSKRSLPEKDKTERTVKRLRSSTQDDSQMQRRSQMSSSRKPETKDKKPELKAKKPETKDRKAELKGQKPGMKDVKHEIKNVKTEIKNVKTEIKNVKTEIKNRKPDIKSKKPWIKSKNPWIKSKKRWIRSKKPEIRANEIKRQSLRKTTLEKSANASVLITSSKPKVYNLNRGKVTNLGVFSEIKEKVNGSDMKYLRYLFRILYDRWPPKNIDELKEEILNFEGYNFKKKSQDLQKREQVLQKMPDTTVTEMCKILDLKVGSKENMISDIIKFLLKPVKIVISTVDPFDPSMQPVIRLERFSLDEYLNKTAKKKNKTPVPVKRSKRERYPSTKLEIYVSDISEKLPVSSVKEEQKKPQSEVKTEKNSKGESSKNVTVKQSTMNEPKTAGKSSVKVNKGSLAAKYAKKRKKGLKLSHKKVVHNQNARQKLMKLAVKIQTTKSPAKRNSVGESFDMSIMSESEIKLEPVVEEVREAGECNEIENTGVAKSSETKHRAHGSNRNRDSSSDATLSSDEAKQMIKADSPRKRVSHKRAGKPLRLFTKIKENILNANFSALQRLHILLFGASDKADNLKGNILAFGGFPFLEGSEEWKQKEFLLSLLAQNTLREYLNLLCIEYTDDDQKTLIRKLMKFLAAPSDRSPGDVIRTQVISSEPVSCAPVQAPKVPIKKKKTKKPEEKKSRTRKVLMDEDQVKRLEADLAREQRILERERRLHEEQTKKLQSKTTPVNEKNKKMQSFTIKDGMESDESLEKKAALTAKQTDAELLNALLQTVYKRRALKKAGVVISAPKKETLTRLGELANVKFLVVTANYSDLDVLHHLIYMTEANKSKVRKNILDFAGFNFSEDTQSYKDRMEFLNSLGYDISKRIAFLLGLCPFKTEIEQQDLNELIMYFLMHPCKSKQIPIRHLPQTFFRKDIPKEICQLMQKHLVDLPVASASSSTSAVESSSEKQPEISVVEEDEPSTPTPVRQKAKKSFKSSCLPSVQRKGLSPSISTLPLSTPKPLLKPLKATQPVLLAGANNKIFLPALGQSPQPTLQKAILKPPTPSITIPSTPNAPQEVLIQQQTPDGQQKTFKLIKLPTTQAMPSNVQSVLKSTPQQTPITIPTPVQPIGQSAPITFTQPVQVSPVISGSLPPGLIFFKGSPPVTVNQSLPNIMQTVPVMLNPSAVNISPIVSVANTSQEMVIAPAEEKSDVPVECEYGEDAIEELDPLADSNPPTDDDLFNSIQEVIHCSDFENITLKNVIDRVAAQYSAFDLTHRHMYMKECIKKIIIGT
ncbi:hypothetical protein AVEN_119114-1 [Araneus ventricosus]|uniref:DEK-C domain-containing protein n=1 Tax=Araneus ventricosus TaxID=182803 RepID=A0A4Y2BN90_ARAVE|nr:hypothetical protein AVEN_119114-1 [Araneus ventricosus]